MVNYYDELEIEDFAWDPVARVFHAPCPCGDRFEISKAQLRNGEEIATCPSCSLVVRVIYDYLDWEDYVSSDDEDDAASSSSSVESQPSPAHNPPNEVSTFGRDDQDAGKEVLDVGDQDQEATSYLTQSLAGAFSNLQVTGSVEQVPSLPPEAG